VSEAGAEGMAGAGWLVLGAWNLAGADRSLAAGGLGRYSGPRCPQAARFATLTARTMVLTRIWIAFNI